MDYLGPDETEVTTIHRHVIGIALFYVQAAVGLAAAVALIYFVLPSVLTTSDENQLYKLGALVILGLFALIFLILLVATFVYRQSKLVITNKHLTQILQQGLFGRKISQLSLSNVEDVTSEQHGMLAMIFNYGTLKVETAGEQANFHFNTCPHPNYYAKQILEARERLLSEADQQST